LTSCSVSLSLSLCLYLSLSLSHTHTGGASLRAARAPAGALRKFARRFPSPGVGGFRVWGLGFRVECSGFGVWGLGFRVEGLGFIQTPMAQGRSTKIISMIKWIWTSRLSIKNSLSLGFIVWDLGFRVWGLGCRVQSLWFRLTQCTFPPPLKKTRWGSTSEERMTSTPLRTPL